MRESVSLHPAFRLGLAGPKAVPELRPLGHVEIDHILGGGLALGRLHEIFGAVPDDAASVAGFAAMLVRRLKASSASIFWLREERTHKAAPLYAPGFAEIGLDPARLVLGVLPDPAAVLHAGVDALRSPGIGMVVIELWHQPHVLDLTASRRMTLAAEGSGATPLLLRIAAAPAPSTAQTRWAVRAVASQPLNADAPGLPALELSLLRQRGGPSGMNWQVEWDRDQTCFRQPALSGAPLSIPGGRPLEAGARWRRTG
jgi:protein ImuA